MSKKPTSTSLVRPFTVVEPSSDIAQKYGVRLYVQPWIEAGTLATGARYPRDLGKQDVH